MFALTKHEMLVANIMYMCSPLRCDCVFNMNAHRQSVVFWLRSMRFFFIAGTKHRILSLCARIENAIAHKAECTCFCFKRTYTQIFVCTILACGYYHRQTGDIQHFNLIHNRKYFIYTDVYLSVCVCVQLSNAARKRLRTICLIWKKKKEPKHMR